MLLSAYRKDEWADPESFVAQLGIVLGGYSDDVVNYVTDPRTGIQRSSKWPPSIAEVVDACEQRKSALDKQAEYDAWKAKVERSNELKQQYGRAEKPLGGITYKEFLERFPQGRPIGVFETPPA